MDKILRRMVESIQAVNGLSGIRSHAVELLSVIASTPSDFDAVWHPLGFMYVNLYSTERRTLRLHIWLSEGQKNAPETSTIHNHIWGLTSYILCGSIINHNVECAYQKGPFTHRIYEISYDKQINILTPTKSLVRCKSSCSTILKPRDVYTLEPGRFHYTVLAKGVEVAATLVVAEELSTGSPQSLGPIEESVFRMERVRCNSNEVSNAASVVLAQLV